MAPWVGRILSLLRPRQTKSDGPRPRLIVQDGVGCSVSGWALEDLERREREAESIHQELVEECEVRQRQWLSPNLSVVSTSTDGCILNHPRLTELVDMWGIEAEYLLARWKQGYIPEVQLPNHIAVFEHELRRLAPTAGMALPPDYPADMVTRFRAVVDKLRREVVKTQVPL